MRTSGSQKLPAQLERKLSMFHDHCARYMILEKYPLALVGSMDETPVFFIWCQIKKGAKNASLEPRVTSHITVVHTSVSFPKFSDVNLTTKDQNSVRNAAGRSHKTTQVTKERKTAEHEQITNLNRNLFSVINPNRHTCLRILFRCRIIYITPLKIKM